MSIRTSARRHIPVALSLVLAAHAVVLPAHAQTAEAVVEAEQRFKEGLRRHDAGDEEGARLSFLQAFSVIKRPNIIFNLARAEQLTGHPVEAIQHYKLFVADNTVTASDREIARKRIAELTPLVGHLQIIAPSGADVWIDGVMLTHKAPLNEPADVAGGMHTVQARLGDQTKTATVVCNAGQTTTTKIDIEVTGTPVVVVPIPGEPGAVAPATAPATPEKQVRYATPGAKIGVMIGLGAGAVGLLAGGIGLEVGASAANTNAANDRAQLQKGGSTSTSVCHGVTTGTCGDLASQVSSHTSDANTGVGLLVGAGVLAAAVAVVWVAWPKQKVVEGARVVPIMTGHGGGVGVVGSF